MCFIGRFLQELYQFVENTQILLLKQLIEHIKKILKHRKANYLQLKNITILND